MKRYESATPRTLLGIAAAAMTAATLAVSVLIPATADFGTREIGVVTSANDVVPVGSPIEGGIAAIDVVATRGTRLVPVAQSQANHAKGGLQG